MKKAMVFLIPIVLGMKCNNTVTINPYGASVPCTFSEVQYGPDDLLKFDICIPQNENPKPLVVYIHGGGFIDGDKRQNMNPLVANSKVASLLNDGIAFASLNYRLVQDDDAIGMKKCLDDCVLAIQNILSNSSYNIDPNKVALWGSSAGAGISMLIGYGNIIDIKAIYVHMPQATYDIQKWAGPTGVFNTCLIDDICTTLSTQKIKDLYGMGFSTLTACGDIISNSSIYRQDVDILLKISSSNEPPIWIQNENQIMDGSYNCNSDQNIINHHKAHCLKLKNRVNSQGQEWHMELYNQNLVHGNGPNYSNAILFIKDKI